jgi:hypothetical protein
LHRGSVVGRTRSPAITASKTRSLTGRLGNGARSLIAADPFVPFLFRYEVRMLKQYLRLFQDSFRNLAAMKPHHEEVRAYLPRVCKLPYCPRSGPYLWLLRLINVKLFDITGFVDEHLLLAPPYGPSVGDGVPEQAGKLFGLEIGER